MATTKQKEAARRNLEKARAARTARAHGERVPKRSPGLSAAEENRLGDDQFAFPEERKEPLSDATHVRKPSPGSIRSRGSPTPSATVPGYASSARPGSSASRSASGIGGSWRTMARPADQAPSNLFRLLI